MDADATEHLSVMDPGSVLDLSGSDTSSQYEEKVQSLTITNW